MHYISKKRRVILALLILSISFVLTKESIPQTVQAAGSNWQDLGRQVLAPNDGWASAEGGTTGGSKAASDHIFTVTNRKQLLQALGSNGTSTGNGETSSTGSPSKPKGDTTPKIIFIKGVINGNEDANGKILTCADYATNGYSFDTYLKTYDPAVWGRTKVASGPVDQARDASSRKQASTVQIYIPSNTTIIGDQTGARVVGANFVLQGSENVIIRNIQFENAIDCFPQWDPTDLNPITGIVGAWNSNYDNISIFGGSKHIWIDHNSFTDAGKLDSQEPKYFGMIYEQHDGELDITKASDLITVSWNRFSEHDKTILIGSSDKSTSDDGKLRVTLHHNDFEHISERAPRVRYGQVHAYNDYNNEAANPTLEYALGVGVSSKIYAQSNYYILPTSFSAGNIIAGVFKGKTIHTTDDLVNNKPVDLLAAYNAAHSSAPLSADVGWTPTFHTQIDPARCVPILVPHNAGVSSSLTVLQISQAKISPTTCAAK